MKTNKFPINVEKLINPIDVGTLHFIPKKIQKKMVQASAKITPYMGFVVEPYSYFLCYEIKDTVKARKLLPDNFELVKSKIFKDDEAKYYGIFGCFNAHTSGFWGLRVEFYVIAKDKKTGLLSWIIIDYDTNTITYDPKNKLSDPNAINSVITIDYDGILRVDVKNKKGRKLIFNSDIKDGVMKDLDQRLWVEGNLSIAYGKNKASSDPGVFSLIFDSLEFKKGLRLTNESLEIKINNWFPGLLNEKPSEIVCFPYAQHFLSDSPGHSSKIENKEELDNKIIKLDFSKIDVFSTKSFKLSFLLGGAISFLSNMTLLMLVSKKNKR